MASHSVVRSVSDLCRRNVLAGCRAISTTTRKPVDTQSTERRKKPFPVLNGEVDTSAESYLKNCDASNLLLSQYEAVLAKSQAGGGEKAILRHVKQNKKLLPTERVRLLLDNIEDFLELSTIAGHAMEYGDVARAGLITGEWWKVNMLLKSTCGTKSRQ